MDKDNNTVISQKEMHEFLHLDPRMKDKGLPSASDVVLSIFDLQDTNKDGVLSYLEFSAPEPKYIGDHNHDEL